MLSSFSLSLWLPILAVLFGATAHALSTDGGGSVLARFGVTWAIPKCAVFPLVLAFGLAAAVVEGVLQGLTWQEAAARGVSASLEAIFGVLGSQHFTGRDGGGNALTALLGLGLALYLAACSVFTPANVAKTELVAKDAACVAEHAFLDDATLNTVCDLLTPERQAAARDVARQRAESGGDGGSDSR